MGGFGLKDLKGITREAVLNIYHTKGLEAADKKVRELLLQCEVQKGDIHERGVIKGELSEIALECHLLWWLQRSKYMMMVKSLCIKSLTSNATAEIDILLATPCKIYLFECKSFKGAKSLTDECYLKGGSSEKDVMQQSKYHLEILDQHLKEYRVPNCSSAPYQLILFELSTDSVDDRRSDKWKKGVPFLCLDTIDQWFSNQFSRALPVAWNYAELAKKLHTLNAQSEKMFKYHMAKILGRR